MIAHSNITEKSCSSKIKDVITGMKQGTHCIFNRVMPREKINKLKSNTKITAAELSCLTVCPVE